MKRARSAMIWMGGGALLAAMAVDSIAVVGRQIGLPLRGSIELVQAAVLVAGSLAIVAATLADHHARVRLIVTRLGATGRRIADMLSDWLSVGFFAALLAGSGWLMLDLWAGAEVSELLGVPWRWMRLFANAALAVAIAAVAYHAVRGRRT